MLIFHFSLFQLFGQLFDIRRNRFIIFFMAAFPPSAPAIFAITRILSKK